jgi:hypothetical protein
MLLNESVNRAVGGSGVAVYSESLRRKRSADKRPWASNRNDEHRYPGAGPELWACRILLEKLMDHPKVPTKSGADPSLQIVTLGDGDVEVDAIVVHWDIRVNGSVANSTLRSN